jgi:hypothetical protein
MANDDIIFHNIDGSKEVFRNGQLYEKVDFEVSEKDMPKIENLVIDKDDFPKQIEINSLDLVAFDISKVNSFSVSELLRILRSLQGKLNIQQYIQKILDSARRSNLSTESIRKLLVDVLFDLIQFESTVSSGSKDDVVIKVEEQEKDDIRIFDDKSTFETELDIKIEKDIDKKLVEISKESTKSIYEVKNREPDTISTIRSLLIEYGFVFDSSKDNSFSIDLDEKDADLISVEIDDFESKCHELNRLLLIENKKAVEKYHRMVFESPIKLSKHHKQVYYFNKDSKGNEISSCVVATLVNALSTMGVFNVDIDLNEIERRLVNRFVDKGFLSNKYFHIPYVLGHFDDVNAIEELSEICGVAIPEIQFGYSYSLEEMVSELMIGNVYLMNFGGHAVLISGVESDGASMRFAVNDPLLTKVSYINAEDLINRLSVPKSENGEYSKDYPAFLIRRMQQKN